MLLVLAVSMTAMRARYPRPLSGRTAEWHSPSSLDAILTRAIWKRTLYILSPCATRTTWSPLAGHPGEGVTPAEYAAVPSTSTAEERVARSCPHRPDGCGRLGRVSLRVAPASSPSLVAVRLPPWASASALAMVSPMPEPPLSASRAASPR